MKQRRIPLDPRGNAAKHMTRTLRYRWAWGAALWALIGIGIVRIVLTYGVFNQTYDEPAHIASGMEWLDQGQYRYEFQHPPLARILVALGPYLAGSRSHGLGMWQEGEAILHAGDYWSTLTVARMGILPFFVLACVIVWKWTRHLFGKPAGLVAVLLFSNLPPSWGTRGSPQPIWPWRQRWVRRCTP